MMLTDPDTLLLYGSVDKLLEWYAAGHIIILTTARPEGIRSFTENQLHSYGIIYNQLIMGVTSGERIVINDNKPEGDITARAISLERNQGIGNIEL